MLVVSSPDHQPQALYHIGLLNFSCDTCQLLSFLLIMTGFPSSTPPAKGRKLAVHCCVPSASPVPGIAPVLSESLAGRRRLGHSAAAPDPLHQVGPTACDFPRDHVRLPLLTYFLTE